VALGVASLGAAFTSSFLELARTDRDNPLSSYVSAALISASISAVGVILALGRGRGSAWRQLLAGAGVWLTLLVAASLAAAWFPIETLRLGVVLWGLALAARGVAFVLRPDSSGDEWRPEPRET
jgi:hypothetical protein